MKSKGFTLIELLIVIAIILILIAIALPNFLEAQIRARVAKARGEMRSLATAMETYIQDFKFYPTDHDNSSIPNGTQLGMFQLTSPINYMGSLPLDPFNSDDSFGGVETGYYEMASNSPTPLMIKNNQTVWPRTGPMAVRNKVQAYMIISAGPIGFEEFNSNDSWPFPGSFPAGPQCPTGEVHGFNYTPTNGTKSNGDLLHFGGEYRTGAYCLDGWMEIRGLGAG